MDYCLTMHCTDKDRSSAATPSSRSGAVTRSTWWPNTSPKTAKSDPLPCCTRAGGVSPGDVHVSVLCVWGLTHLLCRHFHYIPEISAAFFWCVPALFSHPLPFFYPLYLTILLCDRAWRDDKRCSDKYREHWALYCQKVPYKIIPGVI